MIEDCNIISIVLHTQILKQSVLKPASPRKPLKWADQSDYPERSVFSACMPHPLQILPGNNSQFGPDKARCKRHKMAKGLIVWEVTYWSRLSECHVLVNTREGDLRYPYRPLNFLNDYSKRSPMYACLSSLLECCLVLRLI